VDVEWRHGLGTGDDGTSTPTDDYSQCLPWGEWPKIPRAATTLGDKSSEELGDHPVAAGVRQGSALGRDLFEQAGWPRRWASCLSSVVHIGIPSGGRPRGRSASGKARPDGPGPESRKDSPRSPRRVRGRCGHTCSPVTGGSAQHAGRTPRKPHTAPGRSRCPYRSRRAESDDPGPAPGTGGHRRSSPGHFSLRSCTADHVPPFLNEEFWKTAPLYRRSM
jgi:hypothetical protein